MIESPNSTSNLGTPTKQQSKNNNNKNLAQMQVKEKPLNHAFCARKKGN